MNDSIYFNFVRFIKNSQIRCLVNPERWMSQKLPPTAGVFVVLSKRTYEWGACRSHDELDISRGGGDYFFSFYVGDVIIIKWKLRDLGGERRPEISINALCHLTLPYLRVRTGRRFQSTFMPFDFFLN